MNFKIPIWARLVILAAWQALKVALTAAGVPAIAISAIEAVLKQLGILSQMPLTHADVIERSRALHEHCSGVACPPDLKS